MSKPVATVSRLLLASFIFGAAISELARAPAVVESIEQLGYPVWVLWILAPAKLLAVGALTLPAFTRWRTLASFGLLINLVGAVASMVLAGVWLLPDAIVAPVSLILAAVVFAFQLRSEESLPDLQVNPLPKGAPLPARLIVLGATGRVGRTLVTQARDQGVDVVAVVRRAGAFADEAGITELVGDVTDPEFVRAAIGERGQVVSCLGPKERVDICERATAAVAEALAGTTRRYVVLSSAAVQQPGDRRGLLAAFGSIYVWFAF